MKRNAFAKICLCLCVLVAAFSATGCLNTEGDYQLLTEERDALTGELAAARRENEILTAVLNNITQEKERLERALAPYQPAPAAGSSASDPAEGAAPAGGNEAEAAGGRVHVAPRGDTLSNIAALYDTNLNALLDLNPYLRRRDGYMVWENDHIQLPGRGPLAPPENF